MLPTGWSEGLWWSLESCSATLWLTCLFCKKYLDSPIEQWFPKLLNLLNITGKLFDGYLWCPGNSCACVGVWAWACVLHCKWLPLFCTQRGNYWLCAIDEGDANIYIYIYIYIYIKQNDSYADEEQTWNRPGAACRCSRTSQCRVRIRGGGGGGGRWQTN